MVSSVPEKVPSYCQVSPALEKKNTWSTARHFSVIRRVLLTTQMRGLCASPPKVSTRHSPSFGDAVFNGVPISPLSQLHPTLPVTPETFALWMDLQNWRGGWKYASMAHGEPFVRICGVRRTPALSATSSTSLLEVCPRREGEERVVCLFQRDVLQVEFPCCSVSLCRCHIEARCLLWTRKRHHLPGHPVL